VNRTTDYYSRQVSNTHIFFGGGGEEQIWRGETAYITIYYAYQLKFIETQYSRMAKRDTVNKNK